MFAKASGIPSAWPMVTREARSASGDRPGPPRSRMVVGLERRPIKLVGPFLRPAQAAFLAEDADVEAVHAADRDRTRPEPQHRAAVHAQIDHRVVFERAAGQAGDEIGGKLARLLARDITRHVQRVDAAIRELRGNARECGIVAPAHARIVGVGCIGVEAMREFGLDQPDFAEIPAGDHRAHVPDQRITAVAVVDRAEDACPLRGRGDVLGLFDRHRHRLFAEHRDARLEKRFGDFVMRRIRRRDGDEIDPVGSPALAFEHLPPVAIGAVGATPNRCANSRPFAGSTSSAPAAKV